MSDVVTNGAAPVAPPSAVPDVPGSIPDGMVDLDAPEQEAQQPAQQSRGPNGQFAAAEQESAPQGEDAAPAEQASGEADSPEPALPAIERPKSWSADKEAAWAEIPRNLQEAIAERESARDLEVQRNQSEAAEKSKALTAKEQAAEQARQQYEQGVARALQVLDLQSQEFADIKMPADLAKMAEDDPFRFVKWQAHQQQVDHLRREAQTLYDTRVKEETERSTAWSAEQDKIFAEKNRDFADAKKAAEIRDKIVIPYLTEALGVEPGQLPALWQNPIIRDAKMQQALFDGARFHAAQKAAKAAVPQASPAPQRPGTAPARNAATDLAAAADRGDMAKFVEMRAKGVAR